MRVLFDENLPHALAPLLIGHEVLTVHQLGWAALKNGELLRQKDAMSDDPNRLAIAHWVRQYLSGALSYDGLCSSTPLYTEDDDVSELLSLNEHEPKQGGFMGAGPEEYDRYMGRVRELVRVLETRPKDRESAG